MNESPDILWSTAEVAEAVAALPAAGALPTRIAVLPNARMAHAVRRVLLETDRAAALAGTTFTTPVVAAHEVVTAAGVRVSLGEERLRALRLRDLFDAGADFAYFPPDLLRDSLGWDAAFARTIGDLERAGLRPEDLAAVSDEARAADLASAWRYADERAGDSWTSARVLAAATERLREEPGAWPFDGPTLVVADPDESAALLQFLAVAPEAKRVILGARPVRERTLERVRVLLGDEAAVKLRANASPPPDGETECRILAGHLFEPAEALASPVRQRSPGADGTVRFEEHAGIDEEVDAAVAWAVEQVVACGTALQDVAILAPSRDPYTEILVARLSSVAGVGGEPLPVVVPGGVPATSRLEGTRLLQLVRALRNHLDRASVAALLPVLRTDDRDSRPSTTRAAVLAHGLGTLGGSPAEPDGAWAWEDAIDERIRALDEQLADPEALRREWDVRRTHEDLVAIRSPLVALANLARACATASSLPEVWQRLRSFADERLVVPPPPVGLMSRLDELFVPEDANATVPGRAGAEALRTIEEVIQAQRISVGRFGEPGIFVGTLADAACLRFQAVRVVGLTEGAVPSTVREDPVLPDELRRELGASARTSADHSEAQLHVVDRLVRNAAARLAFSAPRRDVQRSQREVSSVFIELAAALARPTVDGAEARAIPDSAALERDYFAPSRAEAEKAAREAPVLPAMRYGLVATGVLAESDAKPSDDATDVARITEQLDPARAPGPLDGFLGPEVLAARPPAGLGADRPTSASALGTLLGCPYRYMLERVLHFDGAYEPPPSGEIDALSFGSLLHGIWERFAERHGESFGNRDDDLATWQERGEVVVDEEFDRFLAEYALGGGGVRDQQRARTRRAFRALLSVDWTEGAPRRYVGTEIPFGADGGLEVTTASGPLYLSGFIDRVDRAGGVTLVRDLKSGKSHPREVGEAPEYGRDLQIGLYAVALRKLAGELGLPETVVAAYFYPDGDDPERRFEGDDLDALVAATDEWLETGAELLRQGAFPRTPDSGDCRWCPHRAVCGPGSNERSLAQLDVSGPGPQRLAVIKGVVEEESEDD